MQLHFTDINVAKPFGAPADDAIEGEDEEEQEDKASEFLNRVLEKASIEKLTDEIVSIEGLMCLNLSRAKYTVTVSRYAPLCVAVRARCTCLRVPSRLRAALVGLTFFLSAGRIVLPWEFFCTMPCILCCFPRYPKPVHVPNLAGDVCALVQFYSDLVLFRGKQKQHRIKFANISRLFFLPRPDSSKRLLVISLSQPLSVTTKRKENMIVLEVTIFKYVFGSRYKSCHP